MRVINFKVHLFAYFSVVCLIFYKVVTCDGRIIVDKRESSIDRIRNRNYQVCVSSDAEFELFYQNYLKNVSTQKAHGVEVGPVQRWNWKPPSWIKVCSENLKYPVNFTEDGFLAVGDVFYPPEDFCIEQNEKIARLCVSQTTPWKKCCPQGELWNMNIGKCQKSPLHFRAKINETFSPFRIIDTGMKLPATVTEVVSCPPGHTLKILTPQTCRINLPQLERSLSGKTCPERDDEIIRECRFQLTPHGVIYEFSSGLFHRKAEWKRLQHESYCVDGYFNNSLCYSINAADNYVLKDKCRENMRDLLFFCDEGEGKDKSYYLAVIWASTCPFLLIAAVANIALIQRNFHGWSLSCYLLWMFLVNINSIILVLKEEAYGCTPVDFTMKFLYFSTLCWMTAINFGLWRTFRITLPQRIGLRRFFSNCIFCLVFPAVVVTVSYFRGKEFTCDNECALYSHATLPYYSGPLILLILVNLILFVRTSLIIASLRRETSSILQKESKDNYESFRIFAKLFLMTGSIWIVRVVLLFLQLKGLYFTWYGVTLEGVFSIPEAAFSISILLHPEFKKWAWNKSTVYRTVAKLVPCMETRQESNLELTSKSTVSNTLITTTRSPTIRPNEPSPGVEKNCLCN